MMDRRIGLRGKADQNGGDELGQIELHLGAGEAYDIVVQNTKGLAGKPEREFGSGRGFLLET